MPEPAVRVVVLIDWGSKRWQKALIAPGERLRVGRFERADLVLPHDAAMSGLHFEISWDGARCAMRDMGSLQGTSLNGERVTEGEVEHGDFIQAGATTFSVYIEERLPPWAPPPDEPGATEEARRTALAALSSEQAPLHAVLDAAVEPRILTLLRAAPERAQSLYEGQEGEELEDVAPYLVALPKGCWLLERLVDEGWGRRWGSYVVSRRPFAEVRRRLRKNLVVKEKGTGDEIYFRFYDPEILAAAARVYRAGRQRQTLFEDIDAYVVEGRAGEVLRIVA